MYAIKIGERDFTFLKRVQDESQIQTFDSMASATMVAKWYREKGWKTSVVRWCCG